MKTYAQLTDQISERERRNRQLALEAATEGVVLLENVSILPLRPCRIALFGAGARHTVKGGSGSGEVNVRHTTCVEEGLEQAGFEVLTKSWLQRYDEQWTTGKEQFLSSVRRKLWWPSASVLNDVMSLEYRFPTGDLITESEITDCGTDTCIYVITRQSGEGHDLEDVPGSFRMDSNELHNIRICAARFARFILVVNTGSPIDLSPLDDIQGIGAVIYMSQPGMEAGNALAAILTGAQCPSGKLAVSWPEHYSDIPFSEEFAKDPTKALYKEGIYVGYRYYDSFGIAPRYPFGYGLSYTRFTIDAPAIAMRGSDVHCSVRVSNSGKCAGKHVVQVYVRCPGADREFQRLVAFAKTDSLVPGQSQTLEMSFPIQALSYYNESSAQTLLEAGRYLVCIGTSSRDTDPLATLRMNEAIILCRHRNLCKASAQITELHHSNGLDIPAGLPELTINPADLTTEQPDYSECRETLSRQTQAILDRLSAKDLVKFCAGTGMSGEKNGFRTPGAVGHTTTEYISQGIPNIELCDGPAGVRLEKRAVRYPNGNIRAVDVSLSVYEFFPQFLLRLLVLGNPDKGQMLYQFVTGFPIEAMVAQTWNLPLAERIGRAVSEEMSEYGVTFWLAPAMNIVRNPLCGRNYEYYSEDPLLTGQFAAAVTHGVQATQGNYVTIKHFCANNQETNRFTVSSEVDERALREIYLKAFEMVVKSAHPRSIMAAYNRLNGVYCANSRELCTDLLRGEWGFDGVVMTDWYATDQNRADAALAIRQGVDLVMPGGKKVVKSLWQAYEKGHLTDNDLRRAAGRVLEAIYKFQQSLHSSQMKKT